MKNKTFLITGGTTGIGLSTARLLASEGAKVIVTGRNPETLASAKHALPSTAVIVKSDSASIADALALGTEAKKHVATLDGVFLNAGIGQFLPFEASTPELFDSTFNVNVKGLYFQLQSLLPLLANPSSVVLTSSIAGVLSLPNSSIYSATKAAVTSLGKTLAVELAPRGVRVNILSPGPIETPILAKAGMTDEYKATFADKTLVKRIGTSDEVAKLVRFLLSEDAANIVGAEFTIDGGFSRV